MGATAAIGMATAKVGSGIAGAYSKSKAQAAEGEYQSGQIEHNARFQAFQAADAVARGEKTAVKAQQATKSLIGSQRVALAAQGIDIESGSALQVQEESAAIGAEEVLNIRNNAWREAWGYRSAQADMITQAKLTKISSKFAAKRTILTAGLQAVGDVSTSYYQYDQFNKLSKASGSTTNIYTAGNAPATPTATPNSSFQFRLSGAPNVPRRRP